jgi:hypothetical protein
MIALTNEPTTKIVAPVAPVSRATNSTPTRITTEAVASARTRSLTTSALRPSSAAAVRQPMAATSNAASTAWLTTTPLSSPFSARR